MRHLILTALTMIVGLQAEARSLKPYATAELKNIHFQTGTYLADKNITSGSVTIRYIRHQQITLSLQPAFHCPSKVLCAAVMPAPIEFTVPLQSTTVGGCNETIYTGEVNSMPVDGPRTKITVVDNRNNRCKHFRAIDPTEIRLELESPRPYRSEAYNLVGNRLN